MKVVAQQAVGVGIGHGQDVVGVEFEKVAVVAFFEEDVLAVVAAVKDVIVLVVLERDGLGHGVSPCDWRKT